ncbi:MAG TPA: DEAD/DEAH box helicase, partial [Cyclobacteriaceae bacterium]|nr:DEAD/DEAH box helicase [Cyclobacteriaceae bacterium]
MKVSATQPFQIIYSLYQHEFLGFIFESFIVHLDDKGKLTYQHQNISSKNAREFSKGLDDRDFELIELMDSMSQDAILKHFSKKMMKPNEFFTKIYKKDKGDELVQEQIEAYMEKRRSSVMDKLAGKMVFEMGNDGEPTWRKLEVMPHRASIQFHFRRGEDSTNYYPTLSYDGKKIELPNPAAYLVCKDPAWLVVDGKLYGFDVPVDGRKLLPFLSKKFVVIPKNLEETYYNRFVAPLIASFDNVEVNGFEIARHDFTPHPLLTLSELPPVSTKTNPKLFDGDNGQEGPSDDESGKIIFDLSFKYGKHKFRGDSPGPVSVKLEKHDNDYVFHRFTRNLDDEKKYAQTLTKLGLPLRGGFRTAVEKAHAFSWLNENRVNLLNLGFEVSQPDNKDKKYFVGKAVIELDVKESIDWFDIHAKIFFGEYEISFKDLRKLILRKKVEFKLPNGEIAIIPEAWLVKFGDLFALSETRGKNEKPVLKKHHITLLKELQENNLAKVHMSEKLRNLDTFNGIKDYPLPENFQGTLRRYQKAGYNWLCFLNEFRLGGCLADDMGLGKTVQTLAMLQAEKEKGEAGTSLLIMP